MRAAAPALPCLALLAACATITEGTSQVVVFRIDPREAVCVLSRVDDGKLGVVGAGTDRLLVSKDKDDLVVLCEAPGYQAKTVRVASRASSAGLAGTLIDFGITDMITGAMYVYPSEVTVVLEPAAFQARAPDPGQSGNAQPSPVGTPPVGAMSAPVPASMR